MCCLKCGSYDDCLSKDSCCDMCEYLEEAQCAHEEGRHIDRGDK